MADSESKAGHASSDHGHEEHHGIGRYLLVFGALLFLTGLTWYTGQKDFGSANLLIALIIATVKATLVVLFFMHLWDEGGVNRLVFVLSVFFVLILLLGVFGDLWFRMRGLLPNGVPPTW